MAVGRAKVNVQKHVFGRAARDGRAASAARRGGTRPARLDGAPGGGYAGVQGVAGRRGAPRAEPGSSARILESGPAECSAGGDPEGPWQEGAVKTLLVALAHPDDEVACAGTIAVHAARGDRVVLLWLTRGGMTEALGRLPYEEVARRRTAHGEDAARILGAEPRFMDFRDTRVEATPDAAYEVARVVAEIRPDAVLTWGEGWVRGMRHPDHQATGKVVRDAVTLARIGGVVAPVGPHRGTAPVFTLRDEHSRLPLRAVDVTPVLDTILEVGRHYRERVGWPEEEWLRARLAAAGSRWGVGAAEEHDAWEAPGGVGATLF